MDFSKNVGAIDRFYRSLFGIIFLLVAFFWVAGIVRIIFYILSLILLFNAITGFCLVYLVLNISTYVKTTEEIYSPKKKWFLIIALVLLLIGAVGSHIVTKKDFLKDFNTVNQDYKNLLLSASQENRGEAIEYYNKLNQDYENFYEKYISYRPYVIRRDKEFGGDLREVRSIIDDSQHKITYGNMTAGYLSLESIRPIINDIRRRNKLQSDKAAFSEFYGPMGILIDSAKAGDIQEVERSYAIADEKLKYIESFMNDSEVQLIRINLDSLYSLSKKKEFDKIPSRAAELKSSYLKAYLKAG